MDTGEKHELMLRAAWLYHVEGMTQAEVGERLNITRRSVNEMLSEAMETGIVSVSFNSRLAECCELEADLRRAFGLDEAVVVPSPRDPAQVHRVLGRATADHFGRLLARRKPNSVGVGWGATLRETIRFSRSQTLPNLTVRSLIGGLARGAEINTFETVRGFAQVLGAECQYFVAPIYADSPESRDSILAQSVFKRSFDLNRQVEIALLSAGEMTRKSLLVRYGLPRPESLGELEKAGAVGDLMGRFMDAEGTLLNHPVNRQVLAPEMADFLEIPIRIVASGGLYKARIMEAIARAKHANVIVTDTDCARAMLAG